MKYSGTQFHLSTLSGLDRDSTGQAQLLFHNVSRRWRTQLLTCLQKPAYLRLDEKHFSFNLKWWGEKMGKYWACLHSRCQVCEPRRQRSSGARVLVFTCENWSSPVEKMEQWMANSDAHGRYGSPLGPAEDICYYSRPQSNYNSKNLVEWRL